MDTEFPFQSPVKPKMLIGVSGVAGSGKDSVGDILVKNHGFQKFSFSDQLYEEVSKAFNISIDELKDRRWKEKPCPKLTLRNCTSYEFVKVSSHALFNIFGFGFGAYPMSPRQVLQIWGTEYRRQQDELYWIKQSKYWFDALPPGSRAVNVSVRFPNEMDWIHEEGGFCARVVRPGYEPVNEHASDHLLVDGHFDYILDNNRDLACLEAVVDEFVKIIQKL